MEKRKTKRLRFIENTYDLNKIDINKNVNEINQQISILENESNKYYPPNTSKRIDSLGKKKTNTSFYTGTGGNIYIYWKQYLFYDKKKDYLEKFQDALKTNLSIINKVNEGEEKSTNSFFMGDSGIYLFYCIYANEIKNTELFIENFNKLINLKNISNIKNCEIELLYGTSGYLYSLLFLKKFLNNSNDLKIGNNITKTLDNAIIEIFYLLIEKGIKYMQEYNWNSCMLFPFSLSGNRTPKLYLGAAHGLIGNLYMLLNTIKFFPDLLKSDNKLPSTIKNKYKNIGNFLLQNIKYVQTLQIKKTGNFPSDVEGNDSGDKIHFCHGSIGAIHLFILAEEFFPNNGFKETALNCNKGLWERGLLYKGNGVCHGMSGVTYGLIKFFKYTNDEIYLKEAVGICMGTFDKRVQDLVKVYEDPQRRAIGIPDTPYSLMEGNGGCLVMYYDLMSLLNKKQNEWVGVFPGYEIF